MAIPVTCPNPDCGAVANVEEQSLGKRGRCKKCGHVFALARPDGEPASAMSNDASAWKGSAPAAPSNLPEQFGRYRIMKTLGQGGMGAVYLAHDIKLDRQVALKVPFFHPAEGPQAIQRFEREARAAANLDHPNLCPVFDVGEVDGIHFLTMPYIEGQPFSEALGRDRIFTEVHAAGVALKLARALHEAHARGIIHRDLKPGNIMINRHREPVIMDFGLARMAVGEDEPLTRTGHVLGTALYMAPEQAAGDLDAVGPASDVYSLGVILYEMLTGRRPFEGPWSLVVGIKTIQDPDPPSKHRPGLAPTLDATCLKAIARDPKHRYATMAEFAQALEAFLALIPSKASRPAEGQTAEAFSGLIIREGAALRDEEKHPTRPKPATGGEPPRPPHRSKIIAAGSAAVLVLGVIIYIVTDRGKIKVEVDDPKAVVTIDGKKVKIEGVSEPRSSRANNSLEAVKGGQGNARDHATLVSVFEADPNKDGPVPALSPKQTRPDSDPKLVVLYNFDDGQATDRSGHGHHGILSINPPKFTTEGYQAGALELDSSKSNFVTVPININPSEMPQFTMGGWFNTRSASKHETLMSCDNGSFDRALAIDDRPKRAVQRWSAYTGRGVLPGPPVVPGTWVFVVMRHDQATKEMILDVDGARFTTTAYHGLGAPTTSIGKTPTHNPTFDGKIDNLFIFNYCLSDQQIADIRNRGEAAILSITPEGLPQPAQQVALENKSGEKTANGKDRIGEEKVADAEKAPLTVEAAREDPKDPPVAKKEASKKKASRKDAERQDGWISLFNGRDLTGWKKHEKQPGNNWRVVNRLLVGSGPTISHLYTERDDFKDFHLRIEARFNKGGGGGVFLHCPFGPKLPLDDPKWPEGWMATINNGGSLRGITGGLYPGEGPDVFALFPFIRKPFDEWFTLDVIAEGNIFAVLVDGERSANKYQHGQGFSSGHIALQQYGPETEIHFRKIEIKELNRPEQEDLKQIGRFTDTGGRAEHVAFSPDGLRILSGAGYQDYWFNFNGKHWFSNPVYQLRLWDVANGRSLFAMRGRGVFEKGLAFSSDGRQAATAPPGLSTNPVVTWDLQSGKKILEFLEKEPKTKGLGCTAISFSPDDHRVMVALQNGTVLVWDVVTDREQPPITLKAGPIKEDEFPRAVFTADRRHLVTGSRIGAVDLWELETGKRLQTFPAHTGAVRDVACSSDGKLILSCGIDRNVRLWSVDTGKRLKELRGEERNVLCIAVSPDGRRALTAGVDGPVRLWDLATGKEICRMDGHNMPVRTVAFSPDGLKAASGGDDRTVRVWQLPE